MKKKTLDVQINTPYSSGEAQTFVSPTIYQRQHTLIAEPAYADGALALAPMAPPPSGGKFKLVLSWGPDDEEIEMSVREAADWLLSLI